MKSIIVTGGSRGIGRSIVEELAKKGYQVLLNYYQSESKALEIQQELQKKGYSILLYKADVSKRNEVNKMIDFAIQKFKKIDVLINNAGIAEMQLFTQITDEQWNRMLQVNLNSVFYCSQEIVKHMLLFQEGCIINISSIWGQIGASCETHYSTSKAAINGLTKALAKELGPSHIRVNAIAPGCINTDMNKGLSKEEWEQLKEEIPLEKIGQPIDIAKCIQWLIEDSYTTGQIIGINGGWGII